MATINLGRVGFVNKGAHNIATAYKVNDVVTYNSGTYACIQAHTGQLPTVTAYWQNWVANDKALDSSVVHKTGDTMTGTLTTPSLVSTGELYSNDGTTITRVLSSGGVSNIGTITNHPIVLQTNNTDRMRISNTGNVGIGINYPSSRLHVFGEIKTGSSGATSINNRGFIWEIDGTVYGRLSIDNSGNLLSVGSGGIGYGTGSGGTVTQLTSKSTTVTLNKPCGRITTTSESLAANSTVSFIVNNYIFSVTDTILVILKSDNIGGTSNYMVWAQQYSVGQFMVHVRNMSGSALAQSLVINFEIIKGATE